MIKSLLKFSIVTIRIFKNLCVQKWPEKSDIIYGCSLSKMLKVKRICENYWLFFTVYMSTRHSWNPRAITPKKCRCFANTFFLPLYHSVMSQRQASYLFSRALHSEDNVIGLENFHFWLFYVRTFFTPYLCTYKLLELLQFIQRMEW